MKFITVPTHITVIKNGTKYFSSTIENKRHIYAFIDEASLNKCCSFIKTFRKRYKSFPIMEETHVQVAYSPYDFPNISVENENTMEMQRLCYTYGVGLVIVDKFEYEFKVKNIDRNISIADILPEIDQTMRVDLLNYALSMS
jgi:hypothetical protein